MTGKPLEQVVTELIVRHASREWVEYSKVDVVVVGAGPSGLTAAYHLARKGYKVLVLERRLSFGGGIGGGGMFFHKVVAERASEAILRDVGARYVVDGDYLVIDASELMAKLASAALDAGAKIIHGVTVEDVIYRVNPLRITGVAIQWSAVIMSGLHVDPLSVWSKAVVDATGHDAEVVSVVARKVPESGIMPSGERSVHAPEAEDLVVKHSGRVIPGLYVAGMAVAALYGYPRMGPIFGGMLLSGRNVADAVDRDLRGEQHAVSSE